MPVASLTLKHVAQMRLTRFCQFLRLVLQDIFGFMRGLIPLLITRDVAQA